VRTFRGFRPATPRIFHSPPLAPTALVADCVKCGASLAGQPRYSRYRVCDECGYAYGISARDRIASLVDPKSFHEIEALLASSDPLEFADDERYAVRLDEQRRMTGETDAAIIGTGSIRGHDIVLGVLDFVFMGGSMGVAVGEKIAIAADLALRERKPLITIVASGGARMQEGLFSLLQMAKTSAAIQRLHREGVPYLSVLTHPTTGGVFASFASLGDVIVAEPGALIGFAGPRVVEQTLGKPLPPGSHTAEFLLSNGIIDDIVNRFHLRGYLASILSLLEGTEREPAKLQAPSAVDVDEYIEDAWETLQSARNPERPTTLDYLNRICDLFVELHGDRESGDDPAVVAGLGLIDDRRVAIVGFERGHGEESDSRRLGRPVPSGYRKAQRIMRLAARHQLPLITLIDTPGAFPGIESEVGGLAGEIAETLALMSELRTPTVAAITGEGGSGGALAFALADRVLMQRHAIYSVIAPEGAAAILYRDASRAPELAAKLKITAGDCLNAGIVDQIVPEPPGTASADPDAAARFLRHAFVDSLSQLTRRPLDQLVRDRYNRYRSFGKSATNTYSPVRSAQEGRDDKPTSLPTTGPATGAAQ
jgi:acetyl-CoA carboxylase carboxyl transferase beta subunit/acetyl-CoA carboxylase carboxyl transferase alpha subunit